MKLSLPLILAIVWLGLGAAALWPLTIDDAFISYRYADNVVAGRGLAFNPGERTEGFSNPLWVGLLGMARFLGINIAAASKVLGLAASIATLGLVWHWLTQSVTDPKIRWVSLAALAVSLGFPYWTVAGMETPLYTLLITAGVWTLLRDCQAHPAPRFPVSAIVFGLAALTRPEGLIGVIAAGLVFIICQRRLVPAMKWLAGSTVPILALFTFRFWYYGTWLPLPVIAKGSPYWREADRGWQYIVAWAQDNPLLAAGGIAALLLALYSIRSRNKFSGLVLALAAAILLQGAFVIAVAGDWMPLHRFLVPIMPLLAIGLGLGLQAVTSMPRTPRQRSLVQFGGLILCLAGIAWPLLQTPAALRQVTWKSTPTSIGAFARCLAERGVSGSRVAFEDIGIFAYLSDLPIIDSHGLIQPDIAAFNSTHYPGDTVEQRIARSQLILGYQPTHAIGVVYAKDEQPAPEFLQYQTTVPRYEFPPGEFAYLGAILGTPHSSGVQPHDKYYLIYRHHTQPFDERWLACIETANQYLGARITATPNIPIPSRTNNLTVDTLLFFRGKLLPLLHAR